MSRPKTFFNPTPTPKLAHSGPKKSKMTPKPKVRIEENIEIKVV